jgi:hypothetical protein
VPDVSDALPDISGSPGIVAVVGYPVLEGLLIDEDTLAIEAADGKPRALGAWAIADRRACHRG